MTDIKYKLLNPAPGQVWGHKRKRSLYFVTDILNPDNPLDDDNNPPIVQYMDGAGNRWARELGKWHASFEYKYTLN